MDRQAEEDLPSSTEESPKERALTRLALILVALHEKTRLATAQARQYLETLREQIEGLSEKQRVQIEEHAEKAARDLSDLSALTSQERERVTPAIQDAIEDILVEALRARPFLSAAMARSRDLYNAAMAAPYIVGALLVLPQIARILKLDANTVLAVAALFIVVMTIHKRIYKITPHKIVIATDFTLICFYAFGSGSDAPAWAKSWLAEFHKAMGSVVDFLITQVNWSYLHSINWGAAGDAVVHILATTAFIWWIVLAEKYLLWLAAVKEIERPRLAQLTISQIIYNLARIAKRLDAVCDKSSGKGSYVTSENRAFIISLVEEVASTIEDSWFRSLRIGRKDSDREMRRLASGIAQALRKRKPRLAMGGTKNLEDARKAFAVAVLNACDGDWELMSVSDVEPSTGSGRRLAKFTTRLFTLLIPASVGVAAVVYSHMLPTGVTATITTTCSVIFIANVIALFDPTSNGRYDSGAKILELSRKQP
ncbi:hypothetical protein ACQP25_01695 [Microtetraspora malaysiensis]|uniref:hypothetical protein n=1 Tax=Microtetraspora malaysiensis TaxID=161358 RepID=UPI003D8B5020